MKRAIPFLFLVNFFYIAINAFPLSSSEIMTIQSGEAEYDGKELVLTGQVVVQHELGQLSASRLTVIPAMEKDKKSRFSFLRLKENVMIESKENGRLSCQEANIDYEQLKGTFLSSPEHPDVVYINRLNDDSADENASPLIVKSHEMQALFVREEDSVKQISKSSIKEIQANGGVRAYYHRDYVILADKAVYQRFRADSSEKSIEKVFLSTNDSNRKCWITNQNGDEIQATQIILDLNNREIILESPYGTIHSQEAGRLIRFSCQRLIWKELQQLLVLQKNIQLNQGETLQLSTDYEIEIHQGTANKKKEIQSIAASQETEMRYWDEKNKLLHKVLCHGPLIVDHRQSKILMYSPTDEEGRVAKDKQVYMEDVAGDLYADQLQLLYRWNESSLTPIQLNLEGRVKIVSRFDGHLQESGSILQYALADLVDYFPEQRKMILSGKNKQRVLLFDKINRLQMSAPSLEIRREKESGKTSIKGIGDVRFSFIKDELDQLNAHFKLLESIP